MKKILTITILVLVIISAGYFVYTKKAKDLETENQNFAVLMENEEKGDEDTKEKVKANTGVTKIDPQIVGKYFEPHAAMHYIILKTDGTFVHNRLPGMIERDYTKIKGKFFITGSEIKFVYDNGDLDLNLEITQDEKYKGWYIEGQGDQPEDYSGYYFVKRGVDCTYLTEEVVESSDLAEKSELYKHTYEKYPLEIYNLIDRIEGSNVFINLRIKGETDKKTGEVLSNGGALVWLTLDIDKEMLTMMPPNEGEKDTILDFDKDIIDELKIVCKK